MKMACFLGFRIELAMYQSIQLILSVSIFSCFYLSCFYLSAHLSFLFLSFLFLSFLFLSFLFIFFLFLSFLFLSFLFLSFLFLSFCPPIYVLVNLVDYDILLNMSKKNFIYICIYLKYGIYPSILLYTYLTLYLSSL